MSWARWVASVGIVLAALALVGLALALAWFEPKTASSGGLGTGPGGAPSFSAAAPTGSTTPAPSKPSASQPPTPPTATLAPQPGGKPGPSNTGVPAGVALRVINGDQLYTKDNQVISGVDIRGFVRIRANDVTIQNSIVRGGAKKCNSAVIFIEDGSSATIKDSEIDPSTPNPCLDGIWATNATLTRLDIHGVVDGVKAFDNVMLRDSYVHDLSWFASDPNQGGGATHNDAVQTYEGNRHIVLRNNTLHVSSRDNAAFQVTQDGGGTATDLRVESNWLDGGGCTLNFAHKGGPTPMTGIYVIGNRFGRDSKFDCPILISTKTVLSQLSGNVWADTGRPIPQPEQHD